MTLTRVVFIRGVVFMTNRTVHILDIIFYILDYKYEDLSGNILHVTFFQLRNETSPIFYDGVRLCTGTNALTALSHSTQQYKYCQQSKLRAGEIIQNCYGIHLYHHCCQTFYENVTFFRPTDFVSKRSFSVTAEYDNDFLIFN